MLRRRMEHLLLLLVRSRPGFVPSLQGQQRAFSRAACTFPQGSQSFLEWQMWHPSPTTSSCRCGCSVGPKCC